MKERDELEFELIALRRKLKKQEAENAIHVRLLEAEKEIVEEHLQREITLKEAETKRSKLLSRVAISAAVFSVFFCLTAFVAPLQRDTDEHAESNSEQTPEQSTAQVSAPRIKSTTAPAVNTQTEQVDIPYDALSRQPGSEGMPQYEAALEKLKLERLNPNAPVSMEVSRQLAELEERRKQFSEADYTFYDWYFKGITEKERSDCASAIHSFTRALAFNPQSATAYSYRGYCYCSAEQYSSAIADLTKAIQLDPNNAAAYYNRGGSYFYLRQFTQAASDYTVAIAINPNDANTYYNRGTCYFNLNNFDAALADYTRAIELEPGDADSYYNRGVVLHAMHQSAEARNDFAKAKALSPRAYQ